MKKLQCDDCGQIDYVIFDGYDFGDRLLEGVMFKATPNKEDSYDIDLLDKDDKSYLDQLNKKYWLEEALKYITEIDIASCPLCETDVVMPGMEFNEDEPRKTYPAEALTLPEFLSKKGFKSVGKKKKKKRKS